MHLLPSLPDLSPGTSLRGFLGCLLAGVMALLCATAPAQTPEQLRDRINRGTVGVISGGVNGTYIRISAELADVLDNDDLRVLTIVGKGSVQNVADLLYLRGIDIAVVQSDVLEYLRRRNTYPGIQGLIHYITKLYNEEVHLLARDDINSVADLTGRRVNVDRQGSGTAMTASLIFETLGIPMEATHFDQATALEKLRQGEIAALAYVAGKPATLFTTIEPGSGLHFLSLDYDERLLETYLPAQLTAGDYPNLLAPDDTVPTLAVGAVMAVYNWAPDHPRHTKVANMVEQFFDRFDEFQEPARHPKWREVSLSAVVPGWQRFDAAQTWLEQDQPD